MGFKNGEIVLGTLQITYYAYAKRNENQLRFQGENHTDYIKNMISGNHNMN